MKELGAQPDIETQENLRKQESDREEGRGTGWENVKGKIKRGKESDIL